MMWIKAKRQECDGVVTEGELVTCVAPAQIAVDVERREFLVFVTIAGQGSALIYYCDELPMSAFDDISESVFDSTFEWVLDAEGLGTSARIKDKK